MNGSLPGPYYRLWHTNLYDPRTPATCANYDNVTDQFGDTCTSYYDANPTTCSYYDTREFVAAQLCCACGGGLIRDAGTMIDKIAGEEIYISDEELHPMFEYPPKTASEYEVPEFSIQYRR